MQEMLEAHLVQPIGHFSHIFAAVFDQNPSPQAPAVVAETQVSVEPSTFFRKLSSQVVHWFAPVHAAQLPVQGAQALLALS